MKSFLSNEFQLNVLSFILLICSVQCTSQDTSNDTSRRTKAQIPELYEFDPKTVIERRIGNTPEQDLKIFERAGMNPKAHELTPSERKVVDKAFAMLPPLHRKVLKDHLRSISFLDNMPVSAMTSPVNDNDEFKLYDITFNASILKQTVSEWLTEKERACFNKDSSSISVSIEAGSINALVFVLIHEATHIVDGATRILPQQWRNDNEKSVIPAVAACTWSNWLNLLPAFQNSLLSATRYRKGGKIFTMQEALPLYTALKCTPLVSIYSASNWHEDLAEYLTVYHFTYKLGQPYSIILKENGKVILSYKPMESNLVRSRLDFMNLFYN
jgi:hypothetical protein